MTYPSFAVGDVLTASDMNAVGLWKINTTTFTNQTEVNFSNVFTSDFTNYRIVFDSWSSSVAENQILRLRDSGGIISTGNYDTNRLEQIGATVSGVPFTGGSGWFPTYVGASSTAGANVSGHIDIYNPQVATYTRITGHFSRTDNALGNGLYNVTMNGMFRLTTQCTGFALVRNGAVATISGTVSVYGYRK